MNGTRMCVLWSFSMCLCVSRGTNQADNLVLYWRVIKYILLLSHDNVLHLRA